MEIGEQVVIVTGASRGIGHGIASHLADLGARVVLTGRREERLAAACAELEGDHLGIVGNVADRAAMFDLVAQTVDHYGRIDGIVCNAPR